MGTNDGKPELLLQGDWVFFMAPNNLSISLLITDWIWECEVRGDGSFDNFGGKLLRIKMSEILGMKLIIIKLFHLITGLV